MASIRSGQIYKCTNVKGGTTMDLSGGDNKSIIGYGFHSGPNQAWIFDQASDNGWTIKSVGSGKYLGIEESPRDGLPVVAVSERFEWYIFPDEEDMTVYRIYVPNTPFNLDLSDHGNPTPGTTVTLWGKWNGRNQCWRIDPVQQWYVASDHSV
ncbi:carbohydrate-binding module family 13 protein [Serpula lacrymans var. lacrymans S7.3]|uniref:Carbohydrate-binding module family 13 protein n=2 Tax=Serpula lacrymans var. lacrymans TaxID=341189 RepID=F8Q354_SERL3|nr:carbohydrate-binding module family 13 protein [Serpula lacrymans var. lacrymans S7.9]EGN97615.1 carbohydrate-binding module family 13 protein [Serpula lacrymans var. lacrymans S7.3]EGO23207.1 carbohydrate-binding module family 13 protein [Serpula lacrymans var. lacrymans S7.9]